MIIDLNTTQQKYEIPTNIVTQLKDLWVKFDAVGDQPQEIWESLKFQWAFGNGWESLGSPVVNHFYDSEGSYTVSLRVTLPDGTKLTKKQQITVKKLPAENVLDTDTSSQPFMKFHPDSSVVMTHCTFSANSFGHGTVFEVGPNTEKTKTSNINGCMIFNVPVVFNKDVTFTQGYATENTRENVMNIISNNLSTSLSHTANLGNALDDILRHINEGYSEDMHDILNKLDEIKGIAVRALAKSNPSSLEYIRANAPEVTWTSWAE